MHTTRSIAQIFVGVESDVSSHPMICIMFVADLTACRLTFFCVACRRVTPRLWSGGFRVWLL